MADVAVSMRAEPSRQVCEVALDDCSVASAPAGLQVGRVRRFVGHIGRRWRYEVVMAHPRDRERWSDEQLLRAISARDPDAFRAFYRRHLALVLSGLLRETNDPELAADLTAEVFAAVMIAAPRYQVQHETAAPWLLGIARNVLGTSRRRGRVDDQARLRLGFQPLELDDVDLERVHAIVDDGRGEIAQLVRSLPTHERDALHARIVDERDYAEIAQQLRCSELVVRKRVSRGLGRLRAQLKER